MSMFDGNWYIFSGLDDDKLQAVWTQFGLRVSQGYPGTWQMWANSIEAVAFRTWIASGADPYDFTGGSITIGNIDYQVREQIQDIGDNFQNFISGQDFFAGAQQTLVIGAAALGALMLLSRR